MEKGEPGMTSVMHGTWNDLLFTMSDNTHPGDISRTGANSVYVWTSMILRATTGTGNVRSGVLRAQPREPRKNGARRPAGGARRDRTDDLLLAKQALSQLSYGPGHCRCLAHAQCRPTAAETAVAETAFAGTHARA